MDVKTSVEDGISAIIIPSLLSKAYVSLRNFKGSEMCSNTKKCTIKSNVFSVFFLTLLNFYKLQNYYHVKIQEKLQMALHRNNLNLFF